MVVRAFFFFLRFDDSRDLSVVVIGFEIRVDAIEKFLFGSDRIRYIYSIYRPVDSITWLCYSNLGENREIQSRTR